MNTASVKRLIRMVGVVLLLMAGLSLLFCVVLAGSALDKRYSVTQSVGYWPLFTLFLLLVSGYFIAGAPHLVRAMGKRKPDEDKLG